MSISTDLAGAVDEGFSAFAEDVTIDGATASAIVTGLSSDEVLLHGGRGDAGGFRLTIKKSAFPTVPGTLVECAARGRTFNKLTHDERRAHWVLNCGDPSAND